MPVSFSHRRTRRASGLRPRRAVGPTRARINRALAGALVAVLTTFGFVIANPNSTTAAAAATVSAAASTAPIRAAFYYPWFPETENWSSHYLPILGHYNSSDPAILAAHVAMAQYAGLNAFISSWWGQGTKTAVRLPLMLSAARQKGFHIAPYYERESLPAPPTNDQLKSDLAYLSGLSRDPAWLTVSGKPVLFIYNTGTQASCSAVARLERANAGRFYMSAKVFPGYRSCSTQPESWHQYGPAAAYDQQGTYSATVSPGFFKYNESAPRLARNLAAFKADLATQVASGAMWQLTTTFNEWGEGTSVEPAVQWRSQSGEGSYLDAMHAAYAPSASAHVDPVTTSATGPQSVGSAAATNTVSASADAYVTGKSPQGNFGNLPTLAVNARGPVYAHIKFVVSGSNGATSATLRVLSSSSGVVRTRVYAESPSWTESGIDFANAPARGTLLGSLSTLVANQYSSLTVPLQGDGTYAFALTTGATAARNMASRESSTPPQLVFSTAPTTSTTTATPSTTTAPSTTTITSPTPGTTPSTSTTPPSTPTTPSPTTTPKTTAVTTPSPTSTSTPSTSVTSAPKSTVSKVLVFIEENHSLAEMQAGMPYLYSQSQTYGYASDYTAIRHPSLPNYLAIAGGSTFGVTDDGNPSVHPIAGPSVFGAAIGAGQTAKSYQESMPSNCYLTASGSYAPKHNPWAYFTSERSDCLANDVPAGTVASGTLHSDIVGGTLPTIGEVTPNLDNDAHDGSLATADTWLKGWLTAIYASPDWTSGHLAVIITADEDDSSSGNKVLTVVIHPSQAQHIVSTALTHYSLTGLLTQLSGAKCIAAGCAATNMANAFGLTLAAG